MALTRTDSIAAASAALFLGLLAGESTLSARDERTSVADTGACCGRIALAPAPEEHAADEPSIAAAAQDMETEDR